MHETNTTNQHIPGLNTTDPQKAVQCVVQLLRRAIHERRFDLWMLPVVSNDKLAEQVQRSWFEGYICKVSPVVFYIELCDVESYGDGINARLQLIFQYEEYETIEEEHIYTLKHLPELREWRIIWMTKVRGSFPRVVPRIAPLTFAITYKSRPWWQEDNLVVLAADSCDPLPVQTYAKAISRTVRYREEFPQIECAAILADCMSAAVGQLAAQIITSDRLQTLGNLYHATENTVNIQISRKDRDNSLNSKLYAPWFGYDELLALRADQGPIVGGCPSIMSLYAALLRLSGYGCLDLFQLRLHNHDVLGITVDNNAFLLTPDRVIELNPRTLYHSSQVYKVFNDAFYWTRFGATNVATDDQNTWCTAIDPIISSLSFDMSVQRLHQEALPLGTALLYPPYVDALEYSHQIKTAILRVSYEHPHSVYTWAKYAYQTLFVSKPAVYAYWSIKSPIVQHMVLQSPDIFDLLERIRGLGRQSIFPENDRLMTADQVLRHQTGDPRARALLLFALFKVATGIAGPVLFTDMGAYYAHPDGSNWIFWDGITLTQIEQPKGRLLLAFDEQTNVYPLLGQHTLASHTVPWASICNDWRYSKSAC